MRKTFAAAILAVVVLHAAPAVASAQTIFGLLLGVDIGKVSGMEAVAGNIRPGLLGGAYLNFALSKVFSLEPELYFAQKGAQDHQDFQEGVMTTTIALSYIELPLLFKVTIPLGEDYISRPHFFAGPYVGYNIRRVFKLAYEDPTGNDDSIIPITDVKKFETGLVVGGGMEWDVKAGLFTIDARYSWSLESISTSSTSRNHVLAIVLGYSFR